ncbi:MAG: type II toxin-antitoxin system PemK/MazF family toxin [Clostridiales Family XIII bacterium]|jgi:mRNA-degrading endonuclease toxin of MazEF toxin-antitoxin module|nr:type II toxin-antitoxin system PemK/MazF family toxin [Clostridiales Family XIII bacterium]
MLVPGQVIWAKLPFPDGSTPDYPRPFLVISVDANRVGVLSVSSVKDKARKLLLPSNLKIEKFDPPLVMPSFVKLDSLTYHAIEAVAELPLLGNGKTLDKGEFRKILAALKRFL